METAIVLFTATSGARQPAQRAGLRPRAPGGAAVRRSDPALTAPLNRARFLAESVAVLQGRAVRARGGDLVIGRGEPVSEVIRLARQTSADGVFVAADVSRYAALRRQRLARECDRHRLALEITPGHAVVPAGELTPSGGDHYRIFTPYWHAWRAAAWRQPWPTPIGHPPAAGHRACDPPALQADSSRSAGGRRGAGKQKTGRMPGWTERLTRLRRGAGRPPPTRRPGSAPTFGSAACHLSSWRWRCRARAVRRSWAYSWAWRDFFHQVTAAFPGHRPDGLPGRFRGDRTPNLVRRREGPGRMAGGAGPDRHPDRRRGDAAARGRGFHVDNRARMITASFLDPHAGHRLAPRLGTSVTCWRRRRRGLQRGNWQWVAGTGNNPRARARAQPAAAGGSARHRRQDYVRRYLPELASLPAPFIHTPWKLPAAQRRQLSYPPPLVSLGAEP